MVVLEFGFGDDRFGGFVLVCFVRNFLNIFGVIGDGVRLIRYRCGPARYAARFLAAANKLVPAGIPNLSRRI